MFEETKLVKKRKLCENQRSMEDMIRQLPEELIFCHILSRLRTVDALKTSILSTKWRHLWKYVPYLALHSRRFSTCNDLVTFINKFLFFHKDSVIPKFQLRIFDPEYNEEWLAGLFTTDDKKVSYVTQWIDVLTRHHKIQHLDFSFGNSHARCIPIPLSLYTCETLVHLRLVGLILHDSKFVSLPCLKSIDFRFVTCPKVTIVEKLISSSHVLEDLTILQSILYIVDAKALRLQSQSLERIYIDSFNKSIQEVVIDAPLLKCFKIKLDFYHMTRVIYSGLSPKVPVHVKFKSYYLSVDQDEISMILDNLTTISTMAKDLVITRNAFKFVHRFSNVESLPQFGCMSCLIVNLFVSELKWFPTFLERCPNLKSLSMEWQPSSKKKKKYVRFKSVPECLLSSLECVDIKAMVSEDAIEVKVVKYFLDNAVVLKKLTLRLNSHPKKNDIFKKILKFPRRSTASQLLLL